MTEERSIHSSMEESTVVGIRRLISIDSMESLSPRHITLDHEGGTRKTIPVLFKKRSSPALAMGSKHVLRRNLTGSVKVSNSRSKSSKQTNSRTTTDKFWRQTSALPSFAKQCVFEWKDLNVYVGSKTDTKSKHILHNFNGCIQSGELLAVMGGSGAGKSTLLNALSGRTNLNEQTVSGYLAINGHKLKCSEQDTIKSICSYVPQSDILCATQTVEEALDFYAHLKLSHLSSEQRQKRINYLIHVLHLESCRNNVIGDEKKRGISGGEKRRVSIASEILNDVDIIFLDEPTSGLDAYTAARTIKTLKQFCAVSNKIIIATIHQPSMEVFYLFDKLMLLSNGKLCFNSAVDDIHICFKEKLRPRTNPADVIVFEVQRNTEKYAAKWSTSSLNAHKEDSCNWDEYGAFDLDARDNNINTNGNMPLIRIQFALLLKREIKGLIRNRRLTIIRLLQLLFFAVTCGGCYFNIKESFDERIRAFFLLLLVVILFGIVTLLTVFPKQKLLFEREYNSRTYNILSWICSIMMIEIPRELIHIVIFTFITYYMIGFDGNILHYWVTFLLTSLSGGSFGVLFGTLCKTPTEAAQAVPAVLLPLLIFSDALITIQNLPKFVHWIAAINPLYYLFRCLYIIEFYGVIYPRNLSEDEEELCNSYQEYQVSLNKTHSISKIINGTVTDHSFNVTTPHLLGGSKHDDALWHNDYYINETEVSAANVTGYDFNQTMNTNYTMDKQKVEHFCSEEVPYTYFFARKHLDPNSLTEYWLYVLLICCILRVVTVMILWINNNKGMSWFYSKIVGIITCRCCRRRRKLDDIDTKEDKENTIKPALV